MARSDGYNTKTRQLILDYLINNRQHAVSASNILEHLEEQGASPNPTTVYRYLDKLAGEQRIMKYVADKGEKAVFQYVDEGRHCREHLHLKCVQCGRIYHLDCHFMDEVRAHPRLAGTGRALDRHARVVEVQHPAHHVVDLVGEQATLGAVAR